MGRIVWDNLTENDLIDYDELANAFKKYLMKALKCDEMEADFVVKSDFQNPYMTPFILQDYQGTYTIEGKQYEVRACRTDFCRCGMFHLAKRTPFKFYMLFDVKTMEDNTVGSYSNARKKYFI